MTAVATDRACASCSAPGADTVDPTGRGVLYCGDCALRAADAPRERSQVVVPSRLLKPFRDAAWECVGERCLDVAHAATSESDLAKAWTLGMQRAQLTIARLGDDALRRSLTDADLVPIEGWWSPLVDTLGQAYGAMVKLIGDETRDAHRTDLERVRYALSAAEWFAVAHDELEGR
jgi:hypothetical protein